MAWFHNLFQLRPTRRSWPVLCGGIVGLVGLGGLPATGFAQSGSLQFSTNSYTVTESSATATVTVVRILGTNTVSVLFSTTNGTAIAGTDYTAVATNLTFSGDQSTNTVAIPILSDLLTEPDETINLILSGPTGGAILGNPSTAVLTLQNDNLPVLQFSTNNVSVSEGDGSAIVTVVRTGGTNITAMVDFTTTNGTATASADYTPTSATLTFLPGETTQTVAVAIIDDAIPETDETVGLVLSNPSSGAALGSTATATLTIHDNEPPVLEFSTDTFRVPENGGSATITVQRLGDPSVTGSVAYATSSGTAIDGKDFIGTSGILPFASGQLSNSFSIAVLNDKLVQDNLTVLLTLSNPVGPGLGSPATAELIIVNDDPETILLTDSDGDQITVTRKGLGKMTVTGTIDAIALSETGTNTTLTVKVKKSRTGDGIVKIGAITGHGSLQRLFAPQADLVGSGIALDGGLGSVTVRDLLGGAGIVAGGTTDQTTRIQVRNIDDGAAIDLGSALRRLRAARFGNALIHAPSAGSIAIAGNKRAGIPANWEGELSLFANPALGSTNAILGRVVVRNMITNGLIRVLHGNAGKVQAVSMINSAIYVGFTPANEDQPLGGGTFEPTSFFGGLRLNGRQSAFANSFVAAAKIGNNRLENVTSANQGVPFGFLAKPSILGLTVRRPPFRLDVHNTNDQGVGDFVVRRLAATGP